MNGLNPTNEPLVYMEATAGLLKVLHGESGLELPLERLGDGRLSEGCKARIATELAAFLKRTGSRPRQRTLCAISARGVSLRQLSLPAATGEELRRLVRLQIESEFPLSPEQLAWGYCICKPREIGLEGNGSRQTVLVAAVKREIVEDYATLLLNCGLIPVFTLAAQSRRFLCSPLQSAFAMLDVGPAEAELVLFENDAPSAVRAILPGPPEPGTTQAARLAGLLKNILVRTNRRKLYLTGEGVRERGAAERLVRELEPIADCDRLESGSGEGRSAAVLGMKRAVAQDGGASLLAIEATRAAQTGPGLKPVEKKWVVRAVALLLAVIIFPYAEALVMKTRLAHKINELENSRDRLVMIDRESAFLEYIRSNAPPYLDAVYLLADAASRGARIQSLTMNRRGEMAFSATMQNPDQVADFRSKLIHSGFYSNVVVEEQTPTPDRQKVNVRLSAQWNSEPARQALVLGPPVSDFNKLRDAVKDAQFSPSGGGMEMPFVMPMGMPVISMPMAAPPAPRPGSKPQKIPNHPAVVLPPSVGGPFIIETTEGDDD